MKKIKVGLFVIILGLFALNTIAKPLKISTTYWPPYTDVDNREHPGILVEVVKEVFALMIQDIIIYNRPWKRAQYEVKQGLVDALFGAAYTEERSTYSIYPEESIGGLMYVFFILEEKKHTFEFNSYADLKDLNIGVVGGAAVTKIKEFKEAGEKWKNLDPVIGQQSIEMNPLKLQGKRIDCYADGLMPGLEIIKILEKKGKLIKKIIPYKKKTIKVTELYLIFSKKAGYTDSTLIIQEFTKYLRKFKKSRKYLEIMNKYH
ncbi:MAG: transporter substrate-binding domain-containing protein [Desulfobacterales bacterium]|nr:transporter substrate-binding domain-containing protein [Desulfobacterales bacterium]